MSPLRAFRWAAWGAVCIAGALAFAVSTGWLVTDGPLSSAGTSPIPADQSIGGPFRMTDHRGRAYSEGDLRGKPALLFFGFTACPDVCPTALAEMSGWLDALGPSGNDIVAVFVSVDPERDDAKSMANYLEAFDNRIVGLTGTSEQLAEFAKAYRIYYRKVPVEGGEYTMDHTASVYLIDRDLRFAALLDFHMDPATAVGKIRRVLP
jgi:protein SCO1/2